MTFDSIMRESDGVYQRVFCGSLCVYLSKIIYLLNKMGVIRY